MQQLGDSFSLVPYIWGFTSASERFCCGSEVALWLKKLHSISILIPPWLLRVDTVVASEWLPATQRRHHCGITDAPRRLDDGSVAPLWWFRGSSTSVGGGSTMAPQRLACDFLLSTWRFRGESTSEPCWLSNSSASVGQWQLQGVSAAAPFGYLAARRSPRGISTASLYRLHEGGSKAARRWHRHCSVNPSRLFRGSSVTA